MRELEDEGKVMALANLAYPVPDELNPMLDWVQVTGTSLRIPVSSLGLYRRLKEVLWKFPSEQFCYMAQRTLEVRVVELVKNILQATGARKLVFSGGVASNIKLNRLLRNLPEVEDMYVFPPMGDGGLALEAAALIADPGKRPRGALRRMVFVSDPLTTDSALEAALRHSNRTYEKPRDMVDAAAQLLAGGEIVFWFQGRMELGPRALGSRSILALPNSQKIKDDLNLKLKKRVWYQPFCPSILEEDAREHVRGFFQRVPGPVYDERLPGEGSSPCRNSRAFWDLTGRAARRSSRTKRRSMGGCSRKSKP